jgi:hypothetical protein
MLMRNIIFISLVVNPDYTLLCCYINFVLSSSSVESSYLADMPLLTVLKYQI